MEWPELPKNWEEWNIVEKLGEGAYGSVYKAERKIETEKISCAIKIIKLAEEENEISELYQLLGTEESVGEYYQDWIKGFVQEIQTMEKLKGITNIVSIQDYEIVKTDKMKWTIYIRMELLQSFPQYLQSHTMSEKEIIQMGIDICTALEYCEKVHIIHRDIKPDNIFVSEMGNYKLGDFGVAKRMDVTKSRYSSRGTYTYMAPEIYHGERYDQRADIYSLGLVLYRLTNGNREPFLDPGKQMIYYKDREEAMRRRMVGEKVPLPVHASERLAHVIIKAIQYKPEERYESAESFQKALEQVLDTGTTIQGKEKKRITHRKNRKIQAAVLACVIVLLGVIMIGERLSGGKKKQKETENDYFALRETEALSQSEMETEDVSFQETAQQTGGAQDNSVQLQYKVKTDGSMLNVRKEAQADSELIQKFENGTICNGTGNVSETGWTEVIIPNTEQTGWVDSQYLVSVSAEKTGESDTDPEETSEIESLSSTQVMSEQVTLTLQNKSEKKKMIVVRIANNTDNSVSTFGLPTLIVSGESVELDPFSNMSVANVEIAAGSYSDITYHINSRAFTEESEISGKLWCMNPGEQDRTYNLKIN